MTRPSSADDPADRLLTLAEAAQMMGAGTPIASMRCEAGLLGEAVIANDGRRQVRESAVRRYLAERDRLQAGALSPREAAIETGLYVLSDEEWREIARKSRT